MAFYLSITAASTTAAFAAQMWKRRRQGDGLVLTRNDNIFYILLIFLSLLPYCLTMGLRYGIGTDYFYTYVPTFESAAQGTYTLEWGFRALMYLVLRFTDDPVWMFIVCACLIVGLTGWTIWKCSAIPWVSILLFVADRHFFVSMNIMRQYMALAVAVCGIRYIREKCLWKYALVILAASLFHTSVLFFLPLGLLAYLPVTPVVGCGAIAVLFVLREPLSKLAYWVISLTRFAHYYEVGGWVSTWLYTERITYLLILTAMASIFYYRNKDDAVYRFLYGLQLIGLFLVLNPSIMIQVDRICLSLEFFHLFLIPKIIASSNSKRVRWIVGTICVVTCAMFTFHEVVQCGYYEVYPYQSIFSSLAAQAA